MKLGMMMFSPETATAEPPAAMTPVEDVYAQALKDAQSGETGEQRPAAPSKQETAKPEKAAATEKPAIAKAAPKSALDAALGGDEPAEAAEPAAVEEDPLKDFPEDAKSKNWKGLRGAAEKAFAELKELRAKAGKHEPDPAIAAELQSVKATLKEREAALAEREAKLAEYNDAMTALDLKNRPDFRKEFYTDRQELVTAAAAKLKNYGGNPDAIIEALELPEGKRRDAAIEEALEALETDSAKDKVRRYVSEIEAKDEKRDKALANSQQSFEELERKTMAQRQQQAAEAERVKQVEFDRITAELRKTSAMLRPQDESLQDGKEWNTALKEDFAKAFQMLGDDADGREIITTSIKGQRYDRVVGMLTAGRIEDRKEIATLRAQLAQFEGAMPDMKGGKPAAKDPKQAALDKDPGDIFAQQMARATAEDDL